MEAGIICIFIASTHMMLKLVRKMDTWINMSAPILTPTLPRMNDERLKGPILLRPIMRDPGTGEAENRDSGLLPNTRIIDLDKEGSDHRHGEVHQRLNSTAFAQLLGELGIDNKTQLIVYDAKGMFSAPRLWWMLKAIGHRNVSLLDGGGAKERAEGGLFNNFGGPPVSAQFYKVEPPAHAWFIDKKHVIAALDTNTQIIDARSAARFHGRAPEPRAGVRSGHIPGAVNLYYQDVLENGRFKAVAVLNALFTKRNIDLQKPIICSCGSGITACIIGVAALLCDAKNVMVYDGSWAQWGADNQLPIAL